MPATEPVQAGPYPVPGDAPDGPNQMAAIVTWAAGRAVMRFASTTTRDAAIPVPTEGMECFTGTGATAIKWLYFDAAWRNVTVRPRATWTPTLTSTGTAPSLGTTGTITGRYVRHGDLIDWHVEIAAGGTGVAAGTGNYLISLPVAVVGSNATPAIGSGYAYTALLNFTNVVAQAQSGGLTFLLRKGAGSLDTWGASWAPMAAGHILSLRGSYLIA